MDLFNFEHFQFRKWEKCLQIYVISYIDNLLEDFNMSVNYYCQKYFMWFQ